MYFKCSTRKNPAIGTYDGYYRLVESYRNISGRVCQRTFLNVGFLGDVSAEQLNLVQAYLMERCRNQTGLFSQADPIVNELTEELWKRLISEKRIDIKEASRTLKVDTVSHTDAREIGAEWMTTHAWNQLNLSGFYLRQAGMKKRFLWLQHK